MIRVEVCLDAESIVAYHSRGHAGNRGSADNTGLVVCNSLSAIEYQFLYAVKGLCPRLSNPATEERGELGVSFEVSKGDFQVNLRRSPEGEEAQTYRILSRSLMIGLEMLKKHHSEEINVKIKNSY